MLRLALTCTLVAVAAPASAQDLAHKTLASVIEESGFEGDISIANGSDPAQGFVQYGLMPEAYRGGDDGLTWRWASVTKQMVAILVMQQVERGAIDLDMPVSTYLPGFASANAGTATVRNLLQHRAGLPNPDASEVDASGWPAFYRGDFTGSRDPVTGYCAGPVKGEVGGDWSYNNCDYMVLGAVLEKVTGLSWDALFMRDIAEPLGLEFVGAYPGEEHTRWGLIDGQREIEIDLANYGASAGLYGSLEDLLAIDTALMRGDLLGEDALAEMWESDPALGYMALGQWVFEAPLKGCEDPVRIVERRGEIGAVQVRNFILPEKQIAVVAFSQAKPFDFGELWTGNGFSFDLLSSAACQS